MSSTKTEKSYRVIYNPNYCKFATCEICIGLCPVKNLVIKDNRVTDLGLCKGCMLCERYCPDIAIEIEVNESGKAAPTRE
ncbi:MAG: hypothetical protein HYY20_11335 [Candidatus Tectomicrobia bacterium]|uniref:4Fe-4S ferredoxin-type domain-containing protein n=1 Tax=Tectimicrobiota bacterium TaxID=2528274 RepID=A0A932G1P1_UNCTE|nr:hypothetical protein [Candidatus Tectomicrobia bacterium]